MQHRVSNHNSTALDKINIGGMCRGSIQKSADLLFEQHQMCDDCVQGTAP